MVELGEGGDLRLTFENYECDLKALMEVRRDGEGEEGGEASQNEVQGREKSPMRFAVSKA